MKTLKITHTPFWFSRYLALLGYIVSRDGLSLDPDKVKAVVRWPIPRTVSEVCGFLGLAGWCRIFVQKYAHISAPLTELTQKEEAFAWNKMRDKLLTS